MSHDQPPLPAMAVLADGRFALRIAMQPLDTARTWEVRRLNRTSTEEQRAIGWMSDGYLADDAPEIAAAHVVEPLVDVLRIADEMEAAGQFAAARTIRERATSIRHTWVGVLT